MLEHLQKEYEILRAQGLKLNMARGKPGSAQLELSHEMLSALDRPFADDGTDCCNYGVLDGLPEAKQMMACMLDDDAELTFVGGNSSLTLMYDTIARFYSFGTLGSTPWCQLEKTKWLCPVPGYDRHFAISELFGFELVAVPLCDDGPDMDVVERLVSHDETIKGIWCVPKYSNPSGISYSDKTVECLASMDCAAKDFRIIWDNAYCVHHLYDEAEKQDRVLDIAEACAKAGNPDRYVKFASTSKVTLPGAGIAAFACSEDNLAEARRLIGIQAIGHDKLNQLRHVRFLQGGKTIPSHMAKHAAILRPKFELIERKFSEGLGDLPGCSWSKPRGGYFVSLDLPEGCAKQTVSLCRDAGVVLTNAGATWPYGEDPRDTNIRIAPTLPPVEELETALEAVVLCAKLAYEQSQASK